VLLFEEAKAIHIACDNLFGLAVVLENLATVAREQGEYERATGIVLECLRVYRTLGSVPGMVDCLSGLADLAALQGDPARAALLIGVEEARREEMRTPRSELNQEALERSLEIVQSTLTAAEYQERKRAGQALTVADAVAIVLGEVDETATATLK
jgi:hypothetical protein